MFLKFRNASKEVAHLKAVNKKYEEELKKAHQELGVK